MEKVAHSRRRGKGKSPSGRNRCDKVAASGTASYCPCKVKGDCYTGMFYTLASCNPNGCGLPNGMRTFLGKKIDQGITDRQIFEEMVKTYGPDLTGRICSSKRGNLADVNGQVASEVALMLRWGTLLLLVAGCTASPERARLETALRAPAQADPLARDRYVIHCPDRLAFQVTAAEPWIVERVVGVDGRVHLPQIGILRVQGQTVPELRQALAQGLHLAPDAVQVQVVEYRSQEVFVHGEVAGEDRAVAYQGPETVLDVLRRAGGIKPGAALADVRVVRGHVVEGRTPEVFEIDLRAILLDNEPDSNVRVEPFDQIYIGTTRRAEWVANLPRNLRPTWARLLGIHRD